MLLNTIFCIFWQILGHCSGKIALVHIWICSWNHIQLHSFSRHLIFKRRIYCILIREFQNWFFAIFSDFWKKMCYKEKKSYCKEDCLLSGMSNINAIFVAFVFDTCIDYIMLNLALMTIFTIFSDFFTKKTVFLPKKNPLKGKSSIRNEHR